jgi:hypothetical protein
MKVLRLTEEQKDLLVRQQFDIDSYFSPSQDNNGVWYISLEERDMNTNPNFTWINDLEEIDYEPKQYPELEGLF